MFWVICFHRGTAFLDKLSRLPANLHKQPSYFVPPTSSILGHRAFLGTVGGQLRVPAGLTPVLGKLSVFFLLRNMHASNYVCPYQFECKLCGLFIPDFCLQANLELVTFENRGPPISAPVTMPSSPSVPSAAQSGAVS
jgi:hypothetical protein